MIARLLGTLPHMHLVEDPMEPQELHASLIDVLPFLGRPQLNGKGATVPSYCMYI